MSSGGGQAGGGQATDFSFPHVDIYLSGGGYLSGGCGYYDDHQPAAPYMASDFSFPHDIDGGGYYDDHQPAAPYMASGGGLLFSFPHYDDHQPAAPYMASGGAHLFSFLHYDDHQPAAPYMLPGGGRHLFESQVAGFSFPQVDLDFSSPASSSGATGTSGAAASSSSAGGGGAGRWAAQLLVQCARAVAGRDSQRVQQLMWMLNEPSYGDVDQKLASYFLQGLFARLTTSGPRTLRTLATASDRNMTFDSTRRTALKFQELSPWASFGHVAANGAILEAFLEAAAVASGAAASSSSSSSLRLHILDLSGNTFCTQWPTLLEALATRSLGDTPHVSITTVVPTAAPAAAAQRVMREIAQRLEKFARLMGVPFTFRAVHHHHAGDLAELDLDGLGLREDTTVLAINCVNALHGIAPGGARRRDAFIASLRRLEPRVVTVVEEDADLVESSSSSAEENMEAFMKLFIEGLRFFSAYMDSLEESIKASNERLPLERAAGRAIVDLLSCPASESVERRETRRMRSAGFSLVAFSDDVADDMRSLLRRYREGWSLREPGADDGGAAAGVFLAWKEQPVVWTSAWKY